MADSSPRLDLPYLMPSQAQKHVTHNEALTRLDTLVQMVVQGIGAEVPPADPQAGQTHALGPAPQDAWDGQGGRLATWDGTAWVFVTPHEGWRLFDVSGGGAQVYSAGQWRPEVEALSGLDGVGIGTGWDGVNRLSVAAEASLFSHAGAGHQIKVNKATAGDTASLLFQSGWTGHAEMGLAGDTAFSVKISPDGGAWHEAMRLDPASSEITFSPAGTPRARLDDTVLELDVPLTGAAVQSDMTDDTAGVVLKSFAFGLGARTTAQNRMDDGEADLGAGFYSGSGGSSNAASFPDSGSRYAPFLNLTRRVSGSSYNQTRVFFSANAVSVRHRETEADPWESRHKLFSHANLVGTVIDNGGMPAFDSAAIECGENANGHYIRLADGTQICVSVPLAVTVSTATGALYSSPETGWTFPAAFSAAPVVCGSCAATTEVWAAARGTSATAGAGRLFAVTDQGAQTLHMMATGRWF